MRVLFLALSKDQHPVVLIVLGTIAVLIGAGSFWLLYIIQVGWKQKNPSPSKFERRNNMIGQFGFFLGTLSVTVVGIFLLTLGVIRLH
jgi:hypothetical protein